MEKKFLRQLKKKIDKAETVAFFSLVAYVIAASANVWHFSLNVSNKQALLPFPFLCLFAVFWLMLFFLFFREKNAVGYLLAKDDLDDNFCQKEIVRLFSWYRKAFSLNDFSGI